ncbi:NlpC/P60 family protein [Streptomyces sp. GESEQ-35]|uniref:NlpC/P60 family protein n=1 Tax=Streptomyces sp. GESEQ-35 TaxID=2812657 RepID=UPI001B334F8E|nr:NlpC/P60 family protein [Streptomyces sp. GESEQ-35]
MDEILSITDAAKSLGVSDRTIHTWSRNGSLVASAGGGLALSEIFRLIEDRREAALARQPCDEEDYARTVASEMWPLVDHEERIPGKTGILFSRRRSADAKHALEARERLLAGDAGDAFGHASIYAAARPLDDGCRWCAARTIAYRLKALAPGDTAAYRQLFGSEPCEADQRYFANRNRLTDQTRRERGGAASGSAALRLQALRFAELKIGSPYEKNASGPTRFDCAGLVSWSYFAAAGLNVPRTKEALLPLGVILPVEEAQPGDLVFAGDATTAHAAIVADGGHVVHAARDVVRYSNIGDYEWIAAFRIGG